MKQYLLRKKITTRDEKLFTDLRNLKEKNFYKIEDPKKRNSNQSLVNQKNFGSNSSSNSGPLSASLESFVDYV